jgi:hypothetical protein
MRACEESRKERGKKKKKGTKKRKKGERIFKQTKIVRRTAETQVMTILIFKDVGLTRDPREYMRTEMAVM